MKLRLRRWLRRLTFAGARLNLLSRATMSGVAAACATAGLPLHPSNMRSYPHTTPIEASFGELPPFETRFKCNCG